MSEKLRKSAKDLRYYTAKMLTFKAHAGQRNNRAKQPTKPSKMKTSAVVKVSFVKEWQSKNGPMYSWHVTMDNGDSGEANTKTPDKGPWAVGEEANYSIDAKEYNGNTYYKITKITPFQQGKPGAASGAKWTPDPEKESRKERWAKQILIGRQACMNTAASLISAGCGPSTVENLTGIADQLETWVKRGIDIRALAASPTAAAVEVAKVAPVAQPAPKPAPPPVVSSDEDDLPF